MFLTEAAEVLERVVRREVLELHEQSGEEFLYGVHELVHELFHLRSRDSVFRTRERRDHIPPPETGAGGVHQCTKDH